MHRGFKIVQSVAERDQLCVRGGEFIEQDVANQLWFGTDAGGRGLGDLACSRRGAEPQHPRKAFERADAQLIGRVYGVSGAGIETRAAFGGLGSAHGDRQTFGHHLKKA